MKNIHEIRDPTHGFIYLDSDERKVLDSRPFQRLRHIHQLAKTYLVYPGATHKRFEHSLGVMELASRVFDIVVNPDNVTDDIRNRLKPLQNTDERSYWRRVLRMAALCHDIGHLPFSHAAEKGLLPEGWDHERLTREIIRSNEMASIWENNRPPLVSEDIEKLAVGPNKATNLQFNDWETILAEIIVGDAFGVDRMDYLLRDSHHVGVPYGEFDHYRLIDTLRILQNESQGLELGMEEGGIKSAEALMLARYFMYSQVYFHPVRRIYNIHLVDFLKKWLEDGAFVTDKDSIPDVLESHLKMTDNEVMAALWEAAFDKNKTGHVHARRIVRREHFKSLYQRNSEDVSINPEPGEAIFKALKDEYNEKLFRHDRYRPQRGSPDFPVRMRDDRIVSSIAFSETLQNIPVVSVDYVFADRSYFDEANKWLNENRSKIITPKGEE